MSGLGQKNKNTDIKKISTLENKHRQKIKEFEIEKDSFSLLENNFDMPSVIKRAAIPRIIIIRLFILFIFKFLF